MSKKQDKAKVAERTPPETPMDSTYGDLSEGLSEDGISVGEESAALTALIDERQQQLFSQQDARLNELMKMVKALAHAVAVPQSAMANQNAGTGNAIASPEAAESSISGSSVKSRVASGTVDVPLPLLTDMLKGFKSDQLYSGQDAENDSKWLEFGGKIVPSLRHQALALFLSDARDLEDIKKDEKFSVAANQLFHDFLSSVTTKTANTVVRSYSTEADGISAWRQLIKMRQSTGSAYFVRQVKALLDDTKRFATLAPPLQGFLNAREVLDRVEEYACTSKFLPGGEKFHVASLEAVFVAMVLNSLNPAYVFVRTMYSGDELPSFQKLNDAVCDHYDNVIATSAAATETGAGIVEDRRKQEEQKRAALLKNLPCPVCHMTGHSSKECFATHEDKREEYLKKNPKRRDAIMKRVQDYQKHGKLPNRAADVTETQEDPGVDASGEALFAICELDSVVTCFSDDMPQFISGYTAGDCIASQSGISLHNYYAVLGGLTSSEGPFPVGGRDQPMSGVYRWRSDAPMSGRSTLRRPGKKSHPCQPNKHRFLLNKHKYFPVAPVYDSFVYIDTLCTVLPGRKLEPTQALWEAGREQHLGPGYQISPRQPWYTSDVQYVHNMFMSGSVEVLDRAVTVLESPHFPADGRVVSHKKMVCTKHLVAEQFGLLQRLLEKEPVMVRGSFEKLHSWVTLLSMVTRDTVQAIESFWTLLGYGYEDEWDFDSSSDGSDDSDHSDYGSGDNTADVFTRALPLTACGGQVAMLDNGASKHIFNSVSDFGDDFDATSSSTFSVVQAGTVSSEGSGTVTFAKLDVSTGRVVGLQFTGAHCIPGQPFNLVSVVALEDVGFRVDFGARQISNGGVTFSFSRVGNQYIIYEDQISGTLDTYMACAAYHDDSDRDKTDWKFEEAGKHIEEHGPFTLELFASSDNHILDSYCTTDNPCFCRDWTGEACYGNPPYEHDTILRCLQKALSDFDWAPHSTKFLLVLPRWETASWWQFTSQFTIIHDYPAGEKIFSAPLDSCYNVENLEMCGEDRVWVRETKWPVVVIYKDGHTVMKLDAKMLAHVRFGHIGDVTMQEMLDEEVPMGITTAQYAKSLVLRCPERCIPCRLTKAIRPSMRPTGRECAEEIGLLVWSDTCGPFRHSAGGYRWFVLFVDDCTAWICVYFLKKKSDYLAALEEFLVEVRKHRSRMKLDEKYHMVLHTDGDSTMIAGQTQQYCKEQGIEQRHGSPYLHENQARVERSHRTVQAMARALLVTSGFGVDVWPLAVRHSVYILNRTFQKPLHKKSPYYKLYGQHQDLSLLRVFGCLAYAFVDPDSREHKLSDRARQLRYVGHSEVSSAYLLYDPESGKIVKSGMVRFHEAVDKLGKVVTTRDPFAVAPLSTNFMVTTLDAAYHDILPSGLEDSILGVGVYLPDGSDEILAVLKVQAVDVTCWVSLRDYLDGQPKHIVVVRSAAHGGDLNVNYPLFTEVMVDAGREKMEAGIICARAVGASSVPYCVMLLTNFTHIDLPVGKVHFPPEHTCLAAVAKSCAGSSVDVLPDGVTEPKGVKQAMGAPDVDEWMEAIPTELEALVTVKQALMKMDMEDVPLGVRLLDMSLVLKVKQDKHRQLQKRKARVCVRGNKEEYGVDYFDTFAFG
ncbi:hypothetical protein CYMTET_50335 [Cymbomonas tetramitiformis]|uniref:Integrase catalytic domain-containing protein n=1 Tax=Cymbomonas tetramitiformis TaxID=36881 RepID=A0AAE0ETT4_9CHLO|nr:hypothetical protein CYMTET_50335 [Cymbomonas tetramitiformis]